MIDLFWRLYIDVATFGIWLVCSMLATALALMFGGLSVEGVALCILAGLLISLRLYPKENKR